VAAPILATVKRVYLDQMHWISLSAAALGLEKGKPFEDALLLARAGLASGALSFPLSLTHYQETSNRRDWKSRRDLAQIMSDLSGFQTIATQNALIEAEIELAFQRFLNVDLGAGAVTPFGHGIGHATGNPLADWSPPEQLRDRLPPGAVWRLKQQFREELEKYSLSGVPPEAETEIKAANPYWDPTAHIAVAKKAAQEQEEARARRAAEGYNKGSNAKDYFAAEAYSEWLPIITDVLAKAKKPPEALLDLGQDGMSKLLKHIPTLWAASEFRRHRSVASQAALVGNDLFDQLALPQAVVYCDVVVTERQHATAFQKLGLDLRHGTTVIHDLRELPIHLV
jgi:hypothetical protein